MLGARASSQPGPPRACLRVHPFASRRGRFAGDVGERSCASTTPRNGRMGLDAILTPALASEAIFGANDTMGRSTTVAKAMAAASALGFHSLAYALMHNPPLPAMATPRARCPGARARLPPLAKVATTRLRARLPQNEIGRQLESEPARKSVDARQEPTRSQRCGRAACRPS